VKRLGYFHTQLTFIFGAGCCRLLSFEEDGKESREEDQGGE